MAQGLRLHENDLYVPLKLGAVLALASDFVDDSMIHRAYLRTRTRIHKVFYPCNRCHLATLLENQRVTCGNEVTRVTEFLLFLRVSVSLYLCISVFTKILHGVAKPRAPRVEAPASVGRRCRLQGSKPRAPWGEGTGSMTLGDYPYQMEALIALTAPPGYFPCGVAAASQ